jgi:hypothetical protein
MAVKDLNMDTAIDSALRVKTAGSGTWRHSVTDVLLLSKKGVWLYQHSKPGGPLVDDVARKLLEAIKLPSLRLAGQLRRLDFGAGSIYVTEGDYVFLLVIIAGEELHPERECMTNAVRELEGKYRAGLTAPGAREAIPGLGEELLRSLGLEQGSSANGAAI